jgi:hypothetical protein
MWGEFWATLGSAGLALLLLCTVLNMAAALILARRSLPRRLRNSLERSEARSEDACIKAEEIAAQVRTWEATLNGLIEENENTFARAEKKRASAAATASRIAAAPPASANGEPPPGATRAERIAWMRRLAS